MKHTKNKTELNIYLQVAISVLIILSTTFCAMLIVCLILIKTTLNAGKMINDVDILPFAGSWNRYNYSENNPKYFVFRKDGTFSIWSTEENVLNGNYTYEKGATTTDGNISYQDSNYIYYTVNLEIDSDNEINYIIAIYYNKSEMRVINLNTADSFTLIRDDSI